MCTVCARPGLFSLYAILSLLSYNSVCKTKVTRQIHLFSVSHQLYVHQKTCLGSTCRVSVVLGDPVDPFNIVSHLGVDTREVSISTADAPGHNAFKFTITYKRSSRVPLGKQCRGKTKNFNQLYVNVAVSSATLLSAKTERSESSDSHHVF